MAQGKGKQLKQYRWLLKEERQLRREIEELHLMVMPGSPLLSGMPRGSGEGADLSSWAAELDTLEAALKEAVGKRLRLRLVIEENLNAMEDARERLVLRERYIRGRSFRDIGEEYGYTERWLWELHKQALRHYRGVQ